MSDGLAGDGRLPGLLARALDASSDLVLVAVQGEPDVHVNAATVRLLGLDGPLVDGDALNERLPPWLRHRVRDEALPALEAGGTWEGELAVHDVEGDLVPIAVVATATRNADGAVEAVVVIARDVSAGSARTGQLERQATHDALTALPNRTLLLDRLDLALGRARRHASLVAVLSLDLDGFKPVNDRLGHAAGDVLLVEVARRLETAVRPGDTAARLGGDEFVVVCDLSHPDEAADLARRIEAEIAQPVRVEGAEVTVTASIGIALSDPAATVEELLRRADAAMYAAKRDAPPVDLP